MYDLHRPFEVAFDDKGISLDHLLAFTTDHLPKMSDNNPGGFLTPRITATTAALGGVNTAFQADAGKLGLRETVVAAKKAFRANLPTALSPIAMAVQTKYGEHSPQVKTFFPQGRAAIYNATDERLGNNLQELVTVVTAHQADLGAALVTSATALLAAWNAVYLPSDQASADKDTSMTAKNNVRAALQLELQKNLLTLALQYLRQPHMLEVYMQPSLLFPPQSQPPENPTPPNP